MFRSSLLKKWVKPSQRIQGWIIFLLSSFFMFYKNAIEVSCGVMTSDLMKEFNINATMLGSLAASYFYAYLLMQIPAGFLIDRFGPKKITTAAIMICAAGSILFSDSQGIVSASIGRFFTGIGASFAAINCIKLLTNWFQARQMGFMTGLMMTIGMMGAVVGQAPLSFLIHHWGWRAAIGLFGFVGFILAFLFFVAVDDVPSQEDQPVVPQQMGFIKTVLTVMKNGQGWLLSLYSGLAFAPVSVFGGLWGVPFIATHYGVDKVTASHSVSLIFIGFAIGAPLSGLISDWLKSRLRVMQVGTSIALLAILAVLYLPPISKVILDGFMLLFGASISGFLVCFTMIREINRPIFAATAVGFMNAFDAFFGAFSDPLTGYFLDRMWDGKIVDGTFAFTLGAYQKALGILPLYLIISLITLCMIKETFKKEGDRVENFP